MTIRCPDCGRIHDLEGKQAGERFSCDCGRLLVVPGVIGGERVRGGPEAPPVTAGAERSVPPPPPPPPPVVRPPAQTLAAEQSASPPVQAVPDMGDVGLPEALEEPPEPPVPGFGGVELRPFGVEPPSIPVLDEDSTPLPAEAPRPTAGEVQAGLEPEAAAAGAYVAPGTTWEFRGVPLLGQGPVTGKPIRAVYQRRAAPPTPRVEPEAREASDLRGQR